MDYSKVLVLCDDLEDVRLESEQADFEKRNLSSKLLKKLLVLVGDIDYGAPLPPERLVCMARIILVAAGHSGPHYWTSHDTRELADEILGSLCREYKKQHYEALLIEDTGLLEAMICYIKTVFTKERWKYYPLHKQALSWCIKQLKHPHLGPYLPSFLPPILWMLDDHSDYNRSLALSLISHIVHHMDPTELRWQGRAELLYQGMKHLFYINSCEVVYALHPCMLKLLPILDQTSSSIPLKFSKTDEAFTILIRCLKKELKIPLLRAYLAQVQGYIYRLGILSARYIKDLLPLLLSGLVHSDPGEMIRKLSLEALSTFISFVWPRISLHKVAILKALSQLVLEVWPDTASVPLLCNDIIGGVVNCLSQLMAACPELKGEYLWLEKSCDHPVLKFCLHTATKQEDN